MKGGRIGYTVGGGWKHCESASTGKCYPVITSVSLCLIGWEWGETSARLLLSVSFMLPAVNGVRTSLFLQ